MENITVKRQRTAQDQDNRLVKLPLELKRMIHGYVAPSFLPLAPASDYRGLYMSCKLIKNLLDEECMHEIPKLRARLRRCVSDDSLPELFKDATTLGDLQELVICLPRSITRSSRAQYEIINDLAPLFALHIATIKIRLYDDPDRQPLSLLDNVTCRTISALPSQLRAWIPEVKIDTSSPRRPDTQSVFQGRHAGDLATLSEHQREYQVLTTFRDLVPLVSRLSCLVEPRICKTEEHTPENPFCIRGVVASPLFSPLEFNAQKLKLELRMLFLEDVYPLYHPSQESSMLNSRGWALEWTMNEASLVHFVIPPTPYMIYLLPFARTYIRDTPRADALWTPKIICWRRRNCQAERRKDAGIWAWMKRGLSKMLGA